jgi:hypothetical protein
VEWGNLHLLKLQSMIPQNLRPRNLDILKENFVGVKN